MPAEHEIVGHIKTSSLSRHHISKIFDEQIFDVIITNSASSQLLTHIKKYQKKK